jgi:Tfp pilus assembly protein PilN
VKEIDFLPQRWRDAQRHRRQNRRNAFWLILMAAALGILYFSNATRIRAVAAVAERPEAVSLEALVNRKAELEARRAVLRSKGDVCSHLDDAAPPDALLAEITRLLSRSMALRALTLETIVSPVGSEVTQVSLEGVAATDVDVGIFFERLASSPLFDQVEMKYSKQDHASGRLVRAFSFRFEVNRVLASPGSGVRE